jgi:glycosyltransferase involved in cell wall biosynthesis
MKVARPIKLGLLATDNREHCRMYGLPEPVFGAPVEALLQGFREYTKEIEVHILSVTQKKLQCPPQLASNIYYHSLVVPKIGWLRTGYQGCIRAVRAKVRNLQLDVVHGQGTERDCGLEAVFSGRPNAVTLHGNMRAVARILRARPFSYHWLHAWLENQVIRRAGLVMCNSAYTEKLVLPLNSSVVRMPNPVRETFFSPPACKSKPRSQRLGFLVVGLIATYKQSLEILRALRAWREGGAPPFHCLWVGAFSGQEGYVGSFAVALAKARDEGWAEHRPQMSAQELKEAMDERDVLIHIPQEEAFGLVVAEAMLRGMKILAGQTGGVVDFQQIYPGIKLVDPNQPAEWARVLADFSRALPARIDRNSWDSLRYHPSKIAQLHCQAYQKLLVGTP